MRVRGDFQSAVCSHHDIPVFTRLPVRVQVSVFGVSALKKVPEWVSWSVA